MYIYEMDFFVFFVLVCATRTQNLSAPFKLRLVGRNLSKGNILCRLRLEAFYISAVYIISEYSVVYITLEPLYLRGLLYFTMVIIHKFTHTNIFNVNNKYK
jgi:hypothetical protein